MKDFKEAVMESLDYVEQVGGVPTTDQLYVEFLSYLEAILPIDNKVGNIFLVTNDLSGKVYSAYWNRDEAEKEAAAWERARPRQEFSVQEVEVSQ